MNIKRSSQITVAMSAALAALLAAPLVTSLRAHEVEALNPPNVRHIALEAGLSSLRHVKPPPPDNLDLFIRKGDEAKVAAVQLGKALFWDLQVGSDGQACASCHFHAGADNRTKNQLNPGLNNEDPILRNIFDPTASGSGGPNYELTAADFPFRQLDSPLDRTSLVLHDSDDVCSSQGVFNADFLEIIPGESTDSGSPSADAVFNVQGINTRRVEPRNTPSVINAVYNFTNFWDGRAHNIFNGVSTGGPLDADATVLVRTDDGLVRRAIQINNASLASQAMAPPQSDIEMAFLDRPFRDLGRKLLSLRPLGEQLVHPDDSVLGLYSRATLDGGKVSGDRGLDISYTKLIKRAFKKKFWDSDETVDGYTHMENNFSLFFGLALHMYQSTLISDQTPFDEFMEGNDAALTLSQLEGLVTFINRGSAFSIDPIFLEFAQGNCITCHHGPEFTSAAFSRLTHSNQAGHQHGGTAAGPLTLIGTQETTALAGDLIIGDQTQYFDIGFSNIGVRPTAEDLGRGGAAFGLPLSFVRQSLLGLEFAPELAGCGETVNVVHVNVRVAASADDAEEDSSQDVNLTSRDLELITASSAQTVGIRFAGVGVPRGAEIVHAHIQFTADEEHSGPTSLVIEGEAADSASGFTTATANVSSRERTSAAVPWSVPEWTKRGEADANHRTPDISGVIQEIVDREGWVQGNALAVIITGTGRRAAESYDGETAAAPLLHVQYVMGEQQNPVSTLQHVHVRVAAGADDAEEYSSERVNLTSRDIELITSSSAQTVGIRFAGVDVPRGANISLAQIQFTADEEHSGPTSLVIEGEAADNAPGFTTATASVSSRERTSAAVPWSVPPWTNTGDAGADQLTPDISGVIQEIVDREGWVQGNALAVIITGTGRRTAESYEGEPAAAPLLHVEYTDENAPTPPPPPPPLECPEDDRDAVDGAFKVPGLRNVELTGPYFHNGGQATLGQVIIFYERLGDFSHVNLKDVDPDLARIFFSEPEVEILVDFLLGLTDERVRNESEPFDHPQLFVPNGHPGSHTALDCAEDLQACDDFLEIPPVGAMGRSHEGLPPLGRFLDLDPFQE